VVRSYLNMRGCEEEGLYRVPGAAHQVRYYEQKFDRGMALTILPSHLVTNHVQTVTST